MASEATYAEQQRRWLDRLIDTGLTTELEVMSPSRWAEERRYLPAANSSLPGYYRFDVTPYLKEIVDCLSMDSPIREVSVMKGVQIGATVGVLENCIGYCIDHVKTAPVMLVTADAELAKLRMESYITPMIQASGLDKCIKSADEKNGRKTGKTDKKIEWLGGGFLIPFGAQNANKLRSLSIQILLNDEIDGWPDVVGKDGDPIKLVRDRTAAYEQSRKILDISTPTLKGQSKIEARFKLGDQRYYHVCCLKCGFPQVLRWKEEKLGVRSGIVWDWVEGKPGLLDVNSVRYLCVDCQHPHINDDKIRLLDPANGAHWKPTATPSTPHHRSYHLSALYSPVGMQTWAACVQKWVEAWDDDRARPRDLGELQVFYNNVLGQVFELRGEKLRFEVVSNHKRTVYQYGQVPNRWAAEHCGGPALLLTCSVDVHKDSLKVAIFGWCRERRALLINYWTLEGDPSQRDDKGTWGELAKLIDDKKYVADDGKVYPLAITLIDSGYLSDQVYEFCSQWETGVYPVKGRDQSGNTANKYFSVFVSSMGTRAFFVTVDLYKDRWSAALRHGWDGEGIQPGGHFNAPWDATDKQLKELTTEVKREKIEAGTNKRVGHEWHRPAGAANELWDCLVYSAAALDMLCQDVCANQLGLEAADWHAFYDICEDGEYFGLS
jgi:phage terminase large subunit GpA-like protein